MGLHGQTSSISFRLLCIPAVLHQMFNVSALLLDDRRRTQAGDASATDQWRDQ